MTLSAAKSILDQLAAPNARVLNLLALSRTPEYQHIWTETPDLVRLFAKVLLRQGHPTLALEAASRGLDYFKNDPELLYRRALALVNSGNTTLADEFIQEMLALSNLDTQYRIETLSLAGRVRKDRASRTANKDLRSDLYREGLVYYQRAYELSRDTFPGINAATLALLSGNPEHSRSLARQVRDAVLAQLEKPGKENDYWLLATLGEAYLLLDDNTAAIGRYRQAVELARQQHDDGNIASMRRQILLLREYLSFGVDLLSLFYIGPVVVFAGHGLDQPGDPQRFPADPALEAAVRRAIKNELAALDPSIGYCMPGCGSDILFGELMRERDGELHIVLPFHEDDFRDERVTYKLPMMESWNQRYKTLRGHLRVTTHFATTEEFLNDKVLFDFAGTFMQGLALNRAAQVLVDPIALVVEDRTTQQARSGLPTFIDNWKKTGHKLRIIDLAEVRGQLQLPSSPAAVAQERFPDRQSHREVLAMLFSDVAGFSGLPEAYLPAFFMRFLELVYDELKSAAPLFQNTWGDGLYIVFPDVVTCADFALRLLRRLEKFDFRSFKFNLKEGKKPGIRIGLHTGPVFRGADAIIGRDNYFGSHVSRAARIEPVTAVGCAFVSEQFAAALALAPNHNFVCEYRGLQPLAKDYDICPLYQLMER